MNPGFGGPLRKDKVWFYVSALYSGSQLTVADMFVNKNANNPNAWTYDPDLSQPAFKDTHYQGGDARVTWQVTPRNKLGLLIAEQTGCTCVGVVSATVAPEADIREQFPIQRRQLLDWTSPLTSRLLLEAGGANHFGRSVRLPSLQSGPQMITVNEQSTGLRYRAADNFRKSGLAHTLVLERHLEASAVELLIHAGESLEILDLHAHQRVWNEQPRVRCRVPYQRIDHLLVERLTRDLLLQRRGQRNRPLALEVGDLATEILVERRQGNFAVTDLGRLV